MAKNQEREKIDWVSAETYLTEIEDAYKELVGMKNVNPWFAIGAISEIRKRFDRGERTQELYDDIMGLK